MEWIEWIKCSISKWAVSFMDFLSPEVIKGQELYPITWVLSLPPPQLSFMMNVCKVQARLFVFFSDPCLGLDVSH
jgi:hypothetical protein